MMMVRGMVGDKVVPEVGYLKVIRKVKVDLKVMDKQVRYLEVPMLYQVIHEDQRKNEEMTLLCHQGRRAINLNIQLKDQTSLEGGCQSLRIKMRKNQGRDWNLRKKLDLDGIFYGSRPNNFGGKGIWMNDQRHLDGHPTRSMAVI